MVVQFLKVVVAIIISLSPLKPGSGQNGYENLLVNCSRSSCPWWQPCLALIPAYSWLFSRFVVSNIWHQVFAFSLCTAALQNNFPNPQRKVNSIAWRVFRRESNHSLWIWYAWLLEHWWSCGLLKISGSTGWYCLSAVEDTNFKMRLHF